MGKNKVTREQILHTACEIFAHKGFNNTTIQDICKQARANIAAVNYYFGSKENLYLEVWEYLTTLKAQKMLKFLDEKLPAEEQLRRLIQARIESVLANDEEGWLPRIIYWEMGNPSSLHDTLRKKYMYRFHQKFLSIIHEILGEDIDSETLLSAGYCINSPLILLLDLQRIAQSGRLKLNPTRNKGILIETMQTIALAGLNEIRNRNGKEKSNDKADL